LRYIDGLSFEETVAALGITPQVLAVTVTRAVKALTRALGEPPDLPGLDKP
jgi:DNA-directed RNA polymerase specialized sigma24 family protein